MDMITMEVGNKKTEAVVTAEREDIFVRSCASNADEYPL